MGARSKQSIRVGVTISDEWIIKNTPVMDGPVDDRIWKTAMRLTGRSLKGMQVYGRYHVSFPVSSLTPEARAELLDQGHAIREES